MVVCAAALGLAMVVDAPVARWMRESGWERALEWDGSLRAFMKTPGEFWVVVAAAVAGWWWHRLGWRAGGFVMLAAVVSGVNGLVKWVVGRHRPYTWLSQQVAELRPLDFLPFRGGFLGLVESTNLAFPSGHTALAFATATALAMLWPKGRWFFYAAATMTGFERVVENAHWASDVVGGAILGVAGVYGLRALCWRIDRRGALLAREFVMQQGGSAEQELATPAMPRRAVMVEVQPQPSTHASRSPQLSLVIPAYNEEENIPTLLQRVGDSLEKLGQPFEVLIVDDGSSDRTPALLSEAMGRLPWLRVIRMAKNSGQSAAFEAGFEAARGQVIATIDADLQNDPEEIPRLVPLLDEMQVDMITGWRKDRQDTSFRRWQSRQANRIRNWISKETVNDSASSLKVYRAHAIRGLKLFNGAHRFFPTLVKMRGFSVYETPVKHSARFAGTAKYGFRNRALRAFIDLLAVRWMKERYLRYRASEVRADGPDRGAGGVAT